MSIFRIYINPKDDAGNFTGFIEVTSDVTSDGFGLVSQTIDNNEFDVGVFKFNSFTIRLRNEHGLYSDIGNIASIFRNRRGGSKFQVRWQQTETPYAGLAIAGKAVLSPEIIIYDGIINDDSSRLDIDDQQITFKVLSSDSVFTEVETPFASISVSDLYSDTIFLILNQTAITKILTIDAANFTVGLDLAMDVVTEFENETVKESLDRLLFQSNSVMFLRDNIVFIKPRDGGLTTVHTFIGQASNDGIEDIQKISSISAGRNQVFNFWTWRDTTLKASDSTSIGANGVRKKKIEFDEITNTAKRQSILDAQRDEFSAQKQEFRLTTFLNYDTLAINMLDRVSVDYPTVISSGAPGAIIPLYGVAIYGEAIYPREEFSITIDNGTPFKIMGIKINKKNQNVTFKIKEI